MAALKAVHKESVVDEVLDQLMEKIISGEWQQGTKIPSENELREAIGVSRDTIRQAIKRLCAQGLLRSEQGRGTFVCEIDISVYLNHMVPLIFLSEDDGTYLLEFMQAIQSASARIAAAKAGDDDIASLRSILEEMKADTSDEEYYERDSRFHLHLAELSGNPLFVRSMEMTSRMLVHYLTNLVRLHGRAESISQHRECLEAIAAHDSAAAESAMHRHYETIRQRLVRLLKEQEDEQS